MRVRGSRNPSESPENVDRRADEARRGEASGLERWEEDGEASGEPMGSEKNKAASE